MYSHGAPAGSMKPCPQLESLCAAKKSHKLKICITEHEGFHPLCLNQWVLQAAAYETRQQYGNETTGRPPHKVVKIDKITASIGEC